jgi:membrane protease YdiL (CAAX protease family)
VQKRLAAALGSQWPAIGVAAILFALYHVPYAYHNPAWGVAGDFRGALEAAAATGLPLGVLLGAVFAIAGERTAASIAAHALINALPGMVIVQRLIGA